jgi:alpha-galactosidase
LEDEIWVRKMSDGSVAAALTNLGTESKTVGVCLSAVGLGGRGRKVAVRDVWQRKDLGTVVDGKFSARISSHDTLLIRLTPSSVE